MFFPDISCTWRKLPVHLSSDFLLFLLRREAFTIGFFLLSLTFSVYSCVSFKEDEWAKYRQPGEEGRGNFSLTEWDASRQKLHGIFFWYNQKEIYSLLYENKT